MLKQILGIDLDDVVIESAPRVIEHHNSKFGTNVTLKDFYSHDLRVWNTSDLDTAIRQINSYMETDEYISSKPAAHTVEAISLLKERYGLYIITGRPSFTEELTRKWLQIHFPEVFDDIVLSNSYALTGTKKRTKGEVCLELGVDILIDDHLEHIKSAAGCGVRGLLFGEYPWNVTDVLPKNVVRVKDWEAVKEVLL